jgi:hypothetical protein
VMRCWTRSELESVFVRSGFGSVAYFGAYDPAIHAGATDRLVAVTQLPEVPTGRSPQPAHPRGVALSGSDATEISSPAFRNPSR